MENKNLFVFRHPKKDGRTKEHIGPVGYASAKAQAATFNKHRVRVDVMMCSDFGRTAETMAAFISQLTPDSNVDFLPAHPGLGNKELFGLVEGNKECMAAFNGGAGWFGAYREAFKVEEVTEWAQAMHDAMLEAINALRPSETTAVIFSHGGQIEIGVWAALGYQLDADNKPIIPPQFDKVPEMGGIAFGWESGRLVPLYPIPPPSKEFVEIFLR